MHLVIFYHLVFRPRDPAASSRAPLWVHQEVAGGNAAAKKRVPPTLQTGMYLQGKLAFY